jgi:hypothetical protein
MDVKRVNTHTHVRERRFPFPIWKEKNKEMVNELYGLFLESCQKHDLKVYHCDDLFREFSYYLYHHSYNASCDTILIQDEMDQEEVKNLWRDGKEEEVKDKKTDSTDSKDAEEEEEEEEEFSRI